MATRLKTVQWALPSFIGAVVDNTLTAMATMTLYCPEMSGTVTWKSCVLRVWMKEGQTQATGNYTTRALAINLKGAGDDSYSNGNLYTGSGENNCVFHSANVTASFVADWSADATATIVVSMLVDFTATTIAARDIEALLECTYEYDDTCATQIKTVLIPLNAPVGLSGTSKPASLCTIPALDTELPESSKVYRNIACIAQGNAVQTGKTTDGTFNMQIDSLTAYASSTLERGAASDYWCAFVYNVLYYDGTPSLAGIGMDTSATHDWYAWAATGDGYSHHQAYMIVTYEFDATADTGVFVSLQLPMELTCPMGGVTSSDYQRGERDFWIAEPGTITTKQIAFYCWWEQISAIAGLNMRVGTGAFITYTDAAAALCGSNGAMCRNDAAFSLAVGKNTLSFDIYRTDTTDKGWNLSGFWIVNYTCSAKPAGGYGAANHTVKWGLGLDLTNTGANANAKTLSAVAPSIPEAMYFLNAVGTHAEYLTNSTGTITGVTVLAEKTAGEGGVEWLNAYVNMSHTDPETGLRQCWSQMRYAFKRWPGDPEAGRLDFETARRWQLHSGANVGCFWALELIFSYHTLTAAVAGTISDSDGGTVDLELHRVSTGEKVLADSRVGDGAYSFTWFAREEMYVTAREDSTHVGRSDDGEGV
jgi:hypothetical protein